MNIILGRVYSMFASVNEIQNKRGIVGRSYLCVGTLWLRAPRRTKLTGNMPHASGYIVWGDCHTHAPSIERV